MKTKIIVGIGLLTMVLTTTLSCNKEAGIGGSSTIKGTLMGFELNPATGDTISNYALSDERIFIIYGDDNAEAYHDSFKSSWNGQYRFEYLKKGTYFIFGYQECLTCATGEEAVFATVEITKNGTEIDLGNLMLDQTQ